MKCPACDRELTSVTAGNMAVDACVNGCGGLWFDNFELKRLDEPGEKDGETLLDIPIAPNANVLHNDHRPCPKCPNVHMMQFSYSPKKAVRVDHCANCGGFWLDGGELRAIRREYTSDEERQKAFDELFAQRFGPVFTIAQQEAEEIPHLPLRRLLSFLFPSLAG